MAESVTTPDDADGQCAPAPGQVKKTIRLIPPDDGPSGPNREWAVTPPSFDSLTAQYALLEKIGDGGMGVVYLARDHKLGRYVAIKRLNAASLENQSLKGRFFREARAVAALNHVHIVHIYSLGEDSQGPYIVMEYIPGPLETSPNKTPPMPFSLADMVHRDGPLTVSEALDLSIKICQAMEYAHGCKVIHRDLKPSNVLLDGNLEPKIVDFGLARKMNPGTIRLTVPGEKMLSLGYGAPEQETDATLCDERADVYGLGALLYFSLTGQNPRYFREGDVPEGLRMPIVKALETDKNKRWASVKDFAAALFLVKAPSSIDVPTVKSTWRCKWCDTVNPVLIRFCGKCGWDGGEMCAECASETRMGIQFCGQCGANAREYEVARLLHEHLSQYHDERAFELIIQQAGQIAGFKPTGPSGRRLVERVHHLREDAQRSLERKAQLRDLIKLDMGARNYGLAEKHIEEYETLATDGLYAKEKEELPALSVDRELERAAESLAKLDWEYAARICTELARTVAPGDPRVKRLIGTIRRHAWRLRLRNTAAACVVLFFAYVFSAAPAFRMLGDAAPRAYRASYGLATLLREETVLRAPLDSYASLWQVSRMYDPKDIPAHTIPTPPAPPTPPESSGHLVSLRANYETALNQIEQARNERLMTRPDEYLAQLLALQKSMQRRGDFEGWSAATEELERFQDEHTMPEIPPDGNGETLTPSPEFPRALPRELLDLQRSFLAKYAEQEMGRYRKIVTTARNYVTSLTSLQKELTKKGNMDDALSVNLEIKRVRSSPEVAAAEKATKSASADDTGNTNPNASAGHPS